MSELKPDAWLLLHQGCRAPDDCEDYLGAVPAGDITGDELNKYLAAGRATPLYTRHIPEGYALVPVEPSDSMIERCMAPGYLDHVTMEGGHPTKP